MKASSQNTPVIWVVIAFAMVYIVWGSTYFFIQMAIKGFPPFLMGATRFIIAGLLMLAWCIFTGQKVWVFKHNRHSAVSGLLMLFGGTGALIWAEQAIPSAVAAILVAAAPVWFVLLDAANWRINLTSPATLTGLIIGFVGVLLLFGEQLNDTLSVHSLSQVPSMIVVVIGSILWVAGSLYSKYRATGSNSIVNSTWQMLAAGVAFLPCSLVNNEFEGFRLSSVPPYAWWAIGYLVVFGSIIAFSAYVWLLQVRSASQVSTYAYVNPVIAVILGVLFAGEHITNLQIGGLVIILISVLLINLNKYRKPKPAPLAAE